MAAEGKNKKTKEKKFSYGGCKYRGTSPQVERLSAETKVLNIAIPFAEALRLNLALDECVRALNTRNMSTREGKDAAVNLMIHFHVGRIAVAEAKTRRRMDATKREGT
jgi:hypothetical protein